jgi:hypothetical protein
MKYFVSSLSEWDTDIRADTNYLNA